jgi:hypothetical protein
MFTWKNMENKMWTTKMLLDLLLCTDIKELWHIEGNRNLQNEHEQIIALLKAFDLYKERRIYDENYNNKTGKEYWFDLGYFLYGDFVERQNKKDVANLLKELTGKTKEQLNLTDLHNGECHMLGIIFDDLILYRKKLQESIDFAKKNFIDTSKKIISKEISTLEKSMKQQAVKIDAILLQIIGDRGRYQRMN